VDLAGVVRGDDLGRASIYIHKDPHQIAIPCKLEPGLYNFSSGPHRNALLGLGEDLPDHRIIEPAPSKFETGVRRQYEVQDGKSLAFHRSRCSIANMGSSIWTG
jgi:hypothetical protein